ncbi:MAG: T9SS type A sorting domain-containing protein [Crocinitomicaceae bacterium]|nr:T9SS type A sorting domain-containing protein [Crocinitomicaceae bacterium]
MVVYREGDFGQSSEFLEIWEDATTTMIGVYGNMEPDCAPEDSTEISFPVSQLYTWENAGVLTVKIRATDDVDQFCVNNRVKVRLVFGYCSFGTPVEIADLTFSDDFVCAQDGMITLSGTPSGGTFSGPGVTGNMLDPSGYLPGPNYVSYTATDGIGCVTTATEAINILGTPAPISEQICEGDSPVINTAGDFGFFSDAAMTNELDYTNSFNVPAVVTSPTYYYYATYLDAPEIYTLDNIAGNNVTIVDHDSETGDDRGGIAFTSTAVYVVGDDNTARYDLDLALAPTILPIRDGMVTDLGTETIYSLYNITNDEMPDYDMSSYFEAEAFIELDADLNPTANIIPFSSTVIVSQNNSQSAIFNGDGYAIIKSGETEEIYKIDFTGQVTVLGTNQLQLFWGESMFDLGVAGFDGSSYVVYYRDWNGPNIVKHNLVSDQTTPITNFTDMSDMANFIYNPALNRLYFHYESSGQFGGMFETFGFMDASHTTAPYTPGYGCPAVIEYTFNSVDLGPDTTVCQEDGYVLEPGLGYLSYTWNGDNNNWNVYPVSSSGTYTVEVEDNIGCILTDDVVVTMEWCSLGNDENSVMNLNAYPVPNKGEFTLDMGALYNQIYVTVYDMQGKLVYSVQENSASLIQVNASVLESGVYLMSVMTEAGTEQLQITIQK